MPVDFYLKLEGIKGESQDKDHKDEIELLSWSWGVTQAGTMHAGTGGGGSKASFQDLSFTKQADLSSTPLLQYCATGKHIAKGTLSCYKPAGDGNRVKYLEMELERILISSYSTGGVDGAQVQSENGSLNFGKFKFTYAQQTETGVKGAAPEFTYDIAKHEAA
jgi:type VI secretion system secreted protein Hcp